MSASPWMEWVRGLSPERDTSEPSESGGWIGVDVSGERADHGVRVLLPLLIIALVAALGIAALRIDLIRTRYAVAAHSERAKELIETQRALIVRRRELRDPVELAKVARERGFRAPAHVLVVPDPTDPRMIAHTSRAELPAVSAGPPDSAGGNAWR